jgi:hypothetical protein
VAGAGDSARGIEQRVSARYDATTCHSKPP